MAPAAVTIDCNDFDALLFDLDGVITLSARVHAAAWKTLFDEFLAARAGATGKDFEPFDIERDYRAYVDGKPRYAGVRDFLAARGIELPQGSADDAAGSATVCGLGNRKNALFLEHLQRDGVVVDDGARALLEDARRHGIPTAVVSASRNCRTLLQAAGLERLFDVVVDGALAAERGLAGKPAPDTFLAAARELGAQPARAVVFEDAVAGVTAGRAGGFGLVVGVDRAARAAALSAHGADVVVRGLVELALTPATPPPSALADFDAVARLVDARRPVLFLDYDGTLTEIVDHPGDARLAPAIRADLAALARTMTVAIVSGRDLPDVRGMVNLPELVYAGSHGFDISGPGGLALQHPAGLAARPALAAAAEALTERLAGIDGILIERKAFAVTVHYRLVADDAVPRVHAALDDVAAGHPGLRRTGGKKIVELRPDVTWDKGRAVRWLLGKLDQDDDAHLPLYLGDDDTDEDAFRALRGRGIGVLVAPAAQITGARFRLASVAEVHDFLERLRRLPDSG